MTPLRFLLAGVVALTLGFGLMSAWRPHSNGESAEDALADADSTAHSTANLREERVGRLNGEHRSVAAIRYSPPVAADIDPSEIPIGFASSQHPPMHLGEPLDADDPWDWEAFTPLQAPVNIGPELDADDPSDWGLLGASGPPRNIGEPLDADDPDSSDWSVATGEPMHIGPPLDVDSPFVHELN